MSNENKFKIFNVHIYNYVYNNKRIYFFTISYADGTELYVSPDKFPSGFDAFSFGCDKLIELSADDYIDKHNPTERWDRSRAYIK